MAISPLHSTPAKKFLKLDQTFGLASCTAKESGNKFLCVKPRCVRCASEEKSLAMLLHVLRLYILLILIHVSEPASGFVDEFIYNSFSGVDLTFDGEASIKDGLLRLTSGELTDTRGHAFYTYPISFDKLPDGSIPSFSTTFVFCIISPYPDLSGHGLAFVLSSTKGLFTGLPSQYLGLLNDRNNGNLSNHLLAIELDTILDPEFQDLNDNHVGVDINDLRSVQSNTAGYYTSDGEFRKLSLISRKPMQVWVDYESKQAVLNVTLAPLFLPKPNRPLLSATVDLSLILTNSVYAGFSSANGVIRASHYILGWSLKLNGEATRLDYSALPLKVVEDLAQQARTRSHQHLRILLPTVTLTAITILVLAGFVKFHMKRRSKAAKHEDWEIDCGTPSFTYKDLVAATNGFKDKMLLGKGGFGRVYKGVLPLSKQIVAIKRVSPESRQGMKEFVAEIAILGHVRHRNLVQLLGYCRHKQELLLVYDYMTNGSLDSYLYSNQENMKLDWTQRFHIIKGVASGLFYLHENWEQVVIHRDIKTSNVLLDNETNGRLGDFGLARSHNHGADAHTTHLAGTWGYIAPELARLGKATKATDVFAFGVVMMEVACGRRPIGENSSGEPILLTDWVLNMWRGGSIMDSIDPRLEDYVAEEVELVLKLGLLCSHSFPNARPCMRLIMQYLERHAAFPEFQPSFLSQDQDESLDKYVLASYPTTDITDLSKGR